VTVPDAMVVPSGLVIVTVGTPESRSDGRPSTVKVSVMVAEVPLTNCSRSAKVYTPHMSKLVTCWCDKPSRGGLTNDEPCTRLATQEDMLCDQCRQGCATIRFGPAGSKPEDMRVVDDHGLVEFSYKRD
jgi:hypothetical protein